MRRDILIERSVNSYSTRSYIAEVFHGQRMFNTMTILSPFDGIKHNRRINEHLILCLQTGVC